MAVDMCRLRQAIHFGQPYNDHWVCPLPPPENRLSVAIRAGEKILHPEASSFLKSA